MTHRLVGYRTDQVPRIKLPRRSRAVGSDAPELFGTYT